MKNAAAVLGLAILALPLQAQERREDRRSIKCFSAIESQGSGNFKANAAKGYTVKPTSYDEVPYHMNKPFKATVRRKAGERAFVAGNAEGTAGAQVDNHLVLVVTDGGETRRVCAGMGVLYHDGILIPNLADNWGQIGGIDLTPWFPAGRDVELEVQALDHGLVGGLSEIHLVFLPDPVEALIQRYLALQAELAELEAAKTFEEQFLEVQRVVGELREALKSTGEESVEAAGKIEKLLEQVRRHHDGTADVLDRVAKGLERAGKAMGSVAGILDRAKNAMDMLEGIVRARNGNATQMIEAFDTYFHSLIGILQLMAPHPAVRFLLSCLSEVVKQIVETLKDLAKEIGRREELTKRLTGRSLYTFPATEREVLGRKIAAKRAEVEAVERELLESHAAAIERVGNTFRAKSAMEQEMETERAAATRSVQNLALKVEELAAARGRAWASLEEARKAARTASNRFAPEDAKSLREQRARLAELAADAPYRDAEGATDAQKKAAREAWFVRRDERAKLRNAVEPLAKKEEAHQAAAAGLTAALKVWNESDVKYRQMESAHVRLMREHMQRLASERKWDAVWLRLKYPELFRP